MSESGKEWLLGLPGHTEFIALEEVVRLVMGGQLRETDLVKRIGEPWRAASEIPKLAAFFREAAGAAGSPGPITSIHAPQEPPRSASEILKAESPLRQSLLDRLAEIKAAPAPGRSDDSPPAPPRAEAPGPAGLKPMVAKYFSPSDLIRAASLSFEPRRLAVAGLLLVPLSTAWSVAGYLESIAGAGWLQGFLFLLAACLLLLGLSVTLTALAFVTRRQLEGVEYRVSGALEFAGINLLGALAYPVLALIPSLVALGLLWLLGLVRDSSTATAGALKVVFIVPMLLAFVAAGGAILYQLASLYVPAAMAVEGRDFRGALASVRSHLGHQAGRVVLHWLIVTVSAGVISAVCLGLTHLTLSLPDLVFGVPAGKEARAAYEVWRESGPALALYSGFAWGLGATLPVSLLSTLGVLSYLALRHPVTAPLASGRMDDTGFGDLQKTPRPAVSPMEATHPSDSRPASTTIRPPESREFPPQPPGPGGSAG